VLGIGFLLLMTGVHGGGWGRSSLRLGDAERHAARPATPPREQLIFSRWAGRGRPRSANFSFMGKFLFVGMWRW